MEHIHSGKSDSPGYTRHYFDEPIGSASIPVILTGPKVKHADGPLTIVDDLGNLVREEEREYTIVANGQQFLDLPNEVKELKTSSGETIKLSSKGS